MCSLKYMYDKKKKIIIKIFNTGQYTVDVCCMTCMKIENNVKLQLAAGVCVNFNHC